MVRVPPAVDRLPPAAYAAALAGLPGVGPGWLVAVLAEHSPGDAWAAVLAGEIGPPARGRPRPDAHGWPGAAGRLDVAAQWDHCRRAGIDVCWPGSRGYPEVLGQGPAPAGVLFSAGALDGLGERRRVAIVGTRRCTPDGRDIAYRLGRDLSDAGVCVISGLALGIDGAAHAGALAAGGEAEGHGRAGNGEAGGPGVGGTVGVAASGVDVVYPRQHAGLWREMVRVGGILSETPPGHPAQAWRFPSRNRLIAGLAEMVVVVECHSKGGSWHTVEAALRRGVEVGAVPGSVRSEASVGTNRLLHEGATPVRGAQDVLDALGVFDVVRSRRQGRRGQSGQSGQSDDRLGADAGNGGCGPGRGRLATAVPGRDRRAQRVTAGRRRHCPREAGGRGGPGGRGGLVGPQGPLGPGPLGVTPVGPEAAPLRSGPPGYSWCHGHHQEVRPPTVSRCRGRPSLGQVPPALLSSMRSPMCDPPRFSSSATEARKWR